MKKISEALRVTIEELEKIAEEEPSYLCKVNSFNKDYVQNFAEWEYEYLQKCEIEKQWINNAFPMN